MSSLTLPVRNAYLPTWCHLAHSCWLVGNLLFNTLISEVEHFSCKGLRHVVLTRAASLSMVRRVLHSVWSLRLYLIDLAGYIVSCILRRSVAIWVRQGPRWVVNTRCSWESSTITVHVHCRSKASRRRIEVCTSLESLIHMIKLCELMFDTHSVALQCHFPMNLRWWMTLSDSWLFVSCCLNLWWMWSYTGNVECLAHVWS